MELLRNSEQQPKIKSTYFKKEGVDFIIYWGITKNSVNRAVFRGEITANILSDIINNTDYTLAELEEIINQSGMSEIEAIKFLKIMISRLIMEYDNSGNVNLFYINNIPVWLDKETRVGLALRFESEMDLGLTDTTLWFNGMQFPVKISEAIHILKAIEVYASRCYDNTQRHLFEVQKLGTVRELVNYNFMSNYPEKLKF